MAGGPPEHHMDRMGYRLGHCPGTAFLAFANLALTRHRTDAARSNRALTSSAGLPPPLLAFENLRVAQHNADQNGAYEQQ